jgi:hypothetical protein
VPRVVERLERARTIAKRVQRIGVEQRAAEIGLAERERKVIRV